MSRNRSAISGRQGRTCSPQPKKPVPSEKTSFRVENPGLPGDPCQIPHSDDEESKWPLYAPKTAKIGDKVQFIGYEGIYNLDEVQWIGQQGIIKLFTDDNVWVYFGDDGNHPGRDSLVKCSWESIAKVLKGGKNLELYEIPAEEKAKKEKSFRFPKAVVDDDEKKR